MAWEAKKVNIRGETDMEEEHLEMAEELDSMALDVTSWEAEFLESVLGLLREGSPLSPKQAKTLKGMYAKYLGEDEGGDGEKGEDEDSE